MKYRNWEGSRLVPGMTRAQAVIAIKLVLICWCLLAVAWLFSGGPVFFGLGLSFCMLAFGLCVGLGDLSVAYLGIAAFTLGSTFFYKRSKSNAVNFWSNYSVTAMNIVGFCLLIAGVWLLFRFWKRASEWDLVSATGTSSRIKPGSEQPSHSETIPWSQSEQPALAQASYRVRLKQLVSGSPEGDWRNVCVQVLLGSLVLGTLLINRGKENITMCFQLLAAFLILIAPVSVFLNRLDVSFERLWLVGESGTRVDTLRRKLVLAATHGFVFFVVVSLALAIQSPSSVLDYATTISILLISFGFSAVLLVWTSWQFRRWKEHPNAMTLLSLFVLTSGILLAFFVSDGSTERANSIVEKAGIAQALITTSFFATVCWIACIWNGARSIANDTVLLE